MLGTMLRDCEVMLPSPGSTPPEIRTIHAQPVSSWSPSSDALARPRKRSVCRRSSPSFLLEESRANAASILSEAKGFSLSSVSALAPHPAIVSLIPTDRIDPSGLLRRLGHAMMGSSGGGEILRLSRAGKHEEPIGRSESSSWWGFADVRIPTVVRFALHVRTKTCRIGTLRGSNFTAQEVGLGRSHGNIVVL